MRHELKCEQIYFRSVLSGEKRFELRRDDRNYQTGDVLDLRETIDGAFTGRSLMADVDYVLRIGPWLMSGFVAMSITPTTWKGWDHGTPTGWTRGAGDDDDQPAPPKQPSA